MWVCDFGEYRKRGGLRYGRWAVVWSVSNGEGEDEVELCLNGL